MKIFIFTLYFQCIAQNKVAIRQDMKVIIRMFNNNFKDRAINNSRIHSLIFSVLILCLNSVLCANNTTPTSILGTSQNHFIPNGSYFQYTFSRMNLELDQYNASISQFNINFTLNFDSKDATYNILIFPQISKDSQPLYQNYAKAVIQGIAGLMPFFPVNYSSPSMKCQDCYQMGLYQTYPIACLNCKQQFITVNLTSQKWAQLSTWNSIYLLKQGTIMTIVDNSYIVGSTGGQIQLEMQYSVSITYDQQYEALFILFLAVISSLIIILAILAVYITLRIKKVQIQINHCKTKTKSQ